MLSSPSQLLLRNTEIFEQGHWALVNAADSDVFSELSHCEISGLHQSFDIFSACQNITPSHHHIFEAEFTTDTPFDGAVVYLPKSKQLLSMLLENISTLLVDGGNLMIVGENKAGIKSVGKLLEKYGDIVSKVDSAKHCGLVNVSVTKPAGCFDLAKYVLTPTHIINDLEIKLATLPGVFGHKQLDEGTSLLLANTDRWFKNDQVKQNMYDFACGSGIIGAYLAKRFVRSRVTLSDVSALALYCAKQTFKMNDLEGEILASDGMQSITDSFDFIASNPPFHKGIQYNLSITQGFINAAHKQMKAHARMCIVANRFLPYPDAIEATFNNIDVAVQTNKFSVYTTKKY